MTTAAGGAPAPSPTVNIKIDGRDVTVARGTNLLEACRQHGVDISYFCYHPGLSSPAVCRQCLVEVKGQPKLVPSCYTPVADHMEVTTASEKVLVARQQMLEFTLVNHPVDCPICDKAGECTLQKLYMEWDGHDSRSDVPKVHKPKMVDLGPHIVLDAERCILCTRCIRVCDEVAHDQQLTMKNRGDHEEIATAPGVQLDNPYSLNTVDVCPVGALTAKDFRFTMRAWELYTVPSVCPGCSTGCNIEVQHAQGEIWRLVPRLNEDVNKYWMCDEGRFTYKAVRERRVAGARLGGDPVSIDKAVAFAAERIQAARQSQKAGALGLVFGAQATNEDLYLLAKVGLDVLGAKAFVAGRPPVAARSDKILRSADVNPNTAGAKAMARAGAGGVAELEKAIVDGQLQALWVVGEDVPLSEAALEKLRSIDVIVQAVHEGPITERARAVLPAAAWAEVDGTFTNSPQIQGVASGRVQRVRKALDASGVAKPSWELSAAIARKLGVAIEFGNVRAVFNEMKAKVPEMAAAEWGRPQPLVQLRFAHSRG
jgi:NADH-quinone oxidoreductase subunit G